MKKKRGFWVNKMIAIIDYDAGNMKSVEKALDFLGAEYIVTKDPAELAAADKLILPGVGAFGDAMEKLTRFGLVEVIQNLVKDSTSIIEGLQFLLLLI